MDAVDLPVSFGGKTACKNNTRNPDLIPVAHAAIGSASDVDKIVRQQYENRIVALRHAVTSDTQIFDANGRLLSSNTQGPWNTFGCVKIVKLEITPDKITLAASRVTYRFNDFTGSFVGQNQSNQIVDH